MLIDKRLIDDIKHGNHITDEELDAAITFYGDLVEYLDCLNLEFKLAANEARNILYKLEGYREERARG